MNKSPIKFEFKYYNLSHIESNLYFLIAIRKMDII